VGPFLSHEKTPPIYAFIGSAQVINRPLLQYWTSATGGNLFKMNVRLKVFVWIGLDWTLLIHNAQNTDEQTILSQIGVPSLSFVASSIEKGEIIDVVPATVTPLVVEADGTASFVVVGKLKSKSAKIKLSYGFGKNKVVHTSEFTLKKSDIETGTPCDKQAWGRFS